MPKWRDGETTRGHNGPLVRVAALSAAGIHLRDGASGSGSFSALMSMARQSARYSPHIIVFPEYTTIGWPAPKPNEIRKSAEPVPGNGPFYRQYVALARESNAVVCGWLVEKGRGGVLYNTSFLIAADGTLKGKYRKVHLSASESGVWGMRPGNAIPVYNLGCISVGICICLDMSFPEVCRTILVKGGELVLHPAATGNRRDICAVRCKENILPMVASVYRQKSYAFDTFGAPAGRYMPEGFLICDTYPRNKTIVPTAGIFRDARATMLALRRPRAYTALAARSLKGAWDGVFTDKEGASINGKKLREKFPYGFV